MEDFVCSYVFLVSLIMNHTSGRKFVGSRTRVLTRDSASGHKTLRVPDSDLDLKDSIYCVQGFERLDFSYLSLGHRHLRHVVFESQNL